ncbi:hypothetical protein [Nocardioides sp. URHA0020]|uniref:hypothetical protein n=1 Tax=Nocardioides sp. URHA0020 TaxID=1380392 RepID=UPI0004915A8D|nr:hypothetical protein [Nocardioides sp. URHA0020]
MHRTRRLLLALLGALSAVFAVAGMWLLLHNPSVKSVSMGMYTCTAPYDTALNEPDNVPGGEPPPDADQVEAACIDAGETRFKWGVASGAGAVLLAVAAGVLFVRGDAAAN